MGDVVSGESPSPPEDIQAAVAHEFVVDWQYRYVQKAVTVIVSRGKPVQIARIEPMEIITHLDGEALTSARQMCRLIAQAKQAGKEKVRLTIQRLAKTRFADLNITTYESKDDEGLESEPKPDEMEVDGDM